MLCMSKVASRTRMAVDSAAALTSQLLAGQVELDQGPEVGQLRGQAPLSAYCAEAIAVTTRPGPAGGGVAIAQTGS